MSKDLVKEEFTGEILELPEAITWERNGYWRNNESSDDKFEETIEFKYPK